MGDVIALFTYFLLYYLTIRFFVTDNAILDFAIKTTLKLGMLIFLNGDLLLYSAMYPNGYTILIPANIMLIFIIIVLISILMSAIKLVARSKEVRV